MLTPAALIEQTEELAHLRRTRQEMAELLAEERSLREDLRAQLRETRRQLDEARADADRAGTRAVAAQDRLGRLVHRLLELYRYGPALCHGRLGLWLREIGALRDPPPANEDHLNAQDQPAP